MCDLNKDYKTAEECLLKGIPFALCVFPNDPVDYPKMFVCSGAVENVKHLHSDNFDNFEGFLFNRFGIQDSFSAYGIENGTVSADNTEYEGPISPYHYVATSKNDYTRQIHSIVDSLESDAEKTVLSRIEIVESDANPITTAYRHFVVHENCFRYILYSPKSGLWLGASPELIADYSNSDGILTTMSLAGTRCHSVADDKDWDRKNILEHDIVTDFISRTLSGFGMAVEAPVPTKAVFKNIEHLCHLIHAKGKISLPALLPRMTPTPAICGWPREKALHQIVDLELHDRNLYGGIIGVKEKSRTRVFLNLRCAYVENPDCVKKRYILFGGGGITRYSDPESEWEETKMKMDSLVKSIRG